MFFCCDVLCEPCQFLLAHGAVACGACGVVADSRCVVYMVGLGNDSANSLEYVACALASMAVGLPTMLHIGEIGKCIEVFNAHITQLPYGGLYLVSIVVTRNDRCAYGDV